MLIIPARERWGTDRHPRLSFQPALPNRQVPDHNQRPCLNMKVDDAWGVSSEGLYTWFHAFMHARVRTRACAYAYRKRERERRKRVKKERVDTTMKLCLSMRSPLVPYSDHRQYFQILSSAHWVFYSGHLKRVTFLHPGLCKWRPRWFMTCTFLLDQNHICIM